MNAKIVRCAAAVLVLMCGPALATVYTWTGGDGDWDDYNNWTCAPSCDPTTYPSTTDDDAVVDTAATIDMSTETIDTLLIGNPGSEDVIFFDAEDSVKTLSVSMISISGGTSDDTMVTIMGNGVIQTRE